MAAMAVRSLWVFVAAITTLAGGVAAASQCKANCTVIQYPMLGIAWNRITASQTVTDKVILVYDEEAGTTSTIHSKATIPASLAPIGLLPTNSAGTVTQVITQEYVNDGSTSTSIFTMTYPTETIFYDSVYNFEGVLPTTTDGSSTCLIAPTLGPYLQLPYPPEAMATLTQPPATFPTGGDQYGISYTTSASEAWFPSFWEEYLNKTLHVGAFESCGMVKVAPASAVQQVLVLTSTSVSTKSKTAASKTASATPTTTTPTTTEAQSTIAQAIHTTEVATTTTKPTVTTPTTMTTAEIQSTTPTTTAKEIPTETQTQPTTTKTKTKHDTTSTSESITIGTETFASPFVTTTQTHGSTSTKTVVTTTTVTPLIVVGTYTIPMGETTTINNFIVCATTFSAGGKPQLLVAGPSDTLTVPVNTVKATTSAAPTATSTTSSDSNSGLGGYIASGMGYSSTATGTSTSAVATFTGAARPMLRPDFAVALVAPLAGLAFAAGL